jgi:hypothetical protein
MHINRLLEVLQNLEEISGPDSPEDYVTVLVVIRNEIDKRIQAAIDINYTKEVI